MHECWPDKVGEASQPSYTCPMPGGPELIIILLVVLVIFGGSQLPKLARGLGSAHHEFKKGLEEGSAPEDKKDEKSEKSDS
jgi:sec-independent protein translocase protein TatA